MSISELEVNYSPSRWSKRFGPEQVLEHHHRFAISVTKSARKNLKCELDVPYGTTERTKYDVYGTDLPKDSPIFVFIHGGYWQEGSKDMAGFAAPVFVGKGIKVITIGYDLCPNVKLGTIVTQIKTAVEHILKTASSLGCKNVWVAGHSAGAHLAVSLLYDKAWLDKMAKEGCLNLLKGVVAIGGIYYLKPLMDTTYGAVMGLTQDEVDTYSFTMIGTKNSTPIQGLKVIVTDGECDSPVIIDESRTCAQKLVTLVDNVHYVLLREQTDHYDIVERLTDTEYLLTKLILNNVLRE